MNALVILFLLFLLGCNNTVGPFSRMGTVGTIRVQAQQTEPSTGQLKTDARGNPVLEETSEINLGQTAFAIPTFGSFYLTNTGETAVTDFEPSVLDNDNYKIVNNECGSTLPPTIEGQAPPKPCRVDVIFNPVTGFSKIKSAFSFNFISKGQKKEENLAVSGISVKEPALAFHEKGYILPGTYAAGAQDSNHNNLYGSAVLVLKYNGDIAPSNSGLPALNFPSPSGAVFPQVGIGANLGFSGLQIQGGQPSYSSALMASIGNQTASNIFFLSSVQDLTQLKLGTEIPVNPYRPKDALGQPNYLSPCISSQTQNGAVIQKSCYLVVSFAPTFTSSKFSKNSAVTASNWQANFKVDLGIQWNFGSSVLTSLQRRTQASINGIGLNGVNLKPLSYTFLFGSDSTGNNITGPFELGPGGQSAYIVVSPVKNNDANQTVGLPVKFSVVNNSGVNAENVVITRLPLPSVPLESNNFYFQSAADLQATTCKSGSNISPSGCLIYLHFAPTPTDYNPKALQMGYRKGYPSLPIQVSYNYATYDVISGPQVAPQSLSVTADAHSPAHLTLSSTSQDLGVGSLLCSIDNSQSPIYILNDGGFTAKLDLPGSVESGPFTYSGCASDLVRDSQCALFARYVPTTIPQQSGSKSISYFTGSTQVYGQPGTTAATAVATIKFTGSGTSNSQVASGFNQALNLSQNIKGAVVGSIPYSSCGPAATVGGNSTTFNFNVCGKNSFDVSLNTTSTDLTLGGLSCTNATYTSTSATSGTVTPLSNATSQITCSYIVTGKIPTSTLCTATPSNAPVSGQVNLVLNDKVLSVTKSSVNTFRYFYAPPSTASWASTAIDLKTTRVGVSSALSSLNLVNQSSYFPITVTAVTSTDSPSPNALTNDFTKSVPTLPLSVSSKGSAVIGSQLVPSVGGAIERTFLVSYQDNIGTSYTTSAKASAMADASVLVQSISTSNIDFGTYLMGSSNSSIPSVSMSVTVLGTYAQWSNPLKTLSSLPSWVQVDQTNSTCISNPPVATKDSVASCSLIFKFNSAQPPGLTDPAPAPYMLTYSTSAGVSANFPSTINFKVAVIEPTTSLAVSPNAIDFGTIYTDGSSNLSPNQTITLTATGNYTAWNTPLTISALSTNKPSWIDIDPNSSCFKTPGVSSGGTPCQISFSLSSSNIPAGVGTKSGTVSIPYRTKSSASATSTLPVNFKVVLANPSANIRLFGSDGLTPLNEINFGKVMAYKGVPRDPSGKFFYGYPANSYEANFMLNYLAPNAWNTSVQGSPSSSFYQGANYVCQTVVAKNTATGAGSAAGSNLQFTLSSGISDLILTNATNSGVVLSNSCVNLNGTMSVTTLNPGSQCPLSVCFAPSNIGSLPSTTKLGGSYANSSTTQDISLVNIFGVGIGPAKVFATGPWTTIVDGQGQKRVLGTGGINGLNSPRGTGLQKASMGDFGYCEIINSLLTCTSNPYSTDFEVISFPSSATPLEISVGSNHACALVNASGVPQVYCWGNNNFGQLGIGASKGVGPFHLPEKVEFNANETPLSVSSGFGYSCSVLSTTSGSTTTRCWGAASQGQMGVGVNTPIFKGSPIIPDPLYFGSNYDATNSPGPSCSSSALTTDVSPASFETKFVCQNRSGALLPKPVARSTAGISSAIFSTSAGETGADQYNCATLTDGTIRCFGQNQDSYQGSNTNFFGLLGPNLTGYHYGLTMPEMASLVSIPLPSYNSSRSSQVQLAMGSNYACALYPRSTDINPSGIYCWGGMLNKNRQPANLGAITQDFSSDSNLAVLGLTFHNPMMVTSGFGHACAVLSDNKVYCWGNSDGFGNFTEKSAGQNGPYAVYEVFDAMK